MDTLKLTAETSKWDIRRKTALNINLYIQLMTHVGSERRGLRPLQWRPVAEELSSVGVGVAVSWMTTEARDLAPVHS